MNHKTELVRPPMPQAGSPEQERRRRKDTLAAAFRIFGRFGMENGSAGHAAVRDPEELDSFWVNPFGRPFRDISADDLILVDDTGAVVAGEGIVNAAAYAIHSRIHAARPDVAASIHLHPTAGMAWASLGRKLEPITQDTCAFYEDHDIYDCYGGPVLDLAEADRIGAKLGRMKALLLTNHGLLTVGATVDEAAWWMIRLDRCCDIALRAYAAGEPRVIPHDLARWTAGEIGTPHAGWFSFQPLLAEYGA